MSFGLVEIPVSLRPATRSRGLGFTLLDREDFAPVGYKRYNKSTGAEVPWERVVRGYEYEEDEFVVLSDEELRQANVEATQTIDIVEFVDRDEIDSVFFDTPYYVEPLKQSSKSYALLREALERTGKVAIARVVLRTRQHLAALVVRDSVLVLDLLHYADEIVPAREIEAPAAGAKGTRITDAEVRMAERLVESLTAKWDPTQFRDEYRDDVLELVQRKVRSGKTHTIVEPGKGAERAPRREVMDLLPLLKQSLAAHDGSGNGAGHGKTARRRPAAKARRTRSHAERRQTRSA